MKTWIYRIALFMLLFGLSALIYGGNSLNPLFDKAISGITMLSLLSLPVFYFRQPSIFKLAAWLLGLGAIGLILESKYDYGQFVYSYFVIKRFAYCSLALLTYAVATQAGPLKIQWLVYIIFAFYIINQLVLGQIFSYNLTSESRTVMSNEALYLVIPCLYYLMTFMKGHRVVYLLLVLFTFALIVFLLHRSVISAAIVAIGAVTGLAMVGKLPSSSFPMGRTMGTFAILLVLLAPALAMMPGNKVNAFLENIGGILDPKEDNTGSWRLEQSEYYLSQIPDKPMLGWRYEGYDRGEIMVNEDFPEKGTIIHSQYIDMLYNYGAVGLAINMLIILGTLTAMYRRNRTFTTEQTVLFGFLISGLIYGVSYQLPVFFWGYVGLAMYYARKQPDEEDESDDYTTIDITESSEITLHPFISTKTQEIL